MIVAVDTNVLVYAADVSAGVRHGEALQILQRAGTTDTCLPLQSLGEFIHVATRKTRLRLVDATALLTHWRAMFTIVPPIEADVDAATAAMARHNLPYWDALLWATVRRAGCRYLLSEDFQDGRTLGGVTFVDPFKAANATILDLALA